MATPVSIIDQTIKVLDKLDKKVENSTPGSIDPRISGGHHSAVIKGKTFYFKTKPVNVIEHAREVAGVYGIELSPNQEKILAELRGTDPVIWDTSCDEMFLLVGQGGGKNTVMEMDGSYQARYLCNVVGNPYELMSLFCDKPLAKNLNFEITNNSLVSASQADTVFFDRIKTALKSTMSEGENFFAKYMGMNMKEEGLGDIKSKVIEFPKFSAEMGGIVYHSLDSKISSPEGKTILTGYMDEPSRAETQNAFQQAKKLYGVIRGNTTGRFKNGVGKTIAFSYPNMSEWDLTWWLIEQEKKAKRIWDRDHKTKPYVTRTKYFVFSTYDLNLTVKRDDASKVKDYATNEEDALARYDCIKSKSQFAFFKPYIHKIRECANPALNNRVTYYQENKTRALKGGSSKDYTALTITEVKGDKRYRMWAADFSINKANSCLMSGYSEQIEEEIGNKISKSTLDGNINIGDVKRKVIIDLILIWTPSKEHPVDYFNAQEIVERMLDEFPNSVKFNCDTYQLSQMTANFEMRGVEAEAFQFKSEKQFRFYTNFKTALSNELVEYIYEPLLIEEAERVQRKLTDGDKLIPGNNFTKDVIDTAVILYDALSNIDPASISALTVGVDRFKDSKLIDLINKMVVYENQAINTGVRDIEEFVKSKLIISGETYQQLQEARAEMFP